MSKYEKICLKSAKILLPTFIASCHSSQQTLLAMIILSLKEDCCVKRFLSNLLVLHCSDCYVICFMLRCDGDVKGIGENRKLLKKKNTSEKLFNFLHPIFEMSFQKEALYRYNPKYKARPVSPQQCLRPSQQEAVLFCCCPSHTQPPINILKAHINF